MYYVCVLCGVRPSVSLRAVPWSYDGLCLYGSGVMTVLNLYLSCFLLITYFSIYNCKSATTRGVLVFLKFERFSSERKETGSSGATESEV